MNTDRCDVLVVDDSALAREVMARALRGAGLSVSLLDSPIGVTRTLLRASVKVVVIDWDMPSMPGDRLATLIRANHRLRDVAIVLVSAKTDRPKPESVDLVIPKTPGAEALTRIVRRLVRIRRRRPSQQAMRIVGPDDPEDE